MGGGVRGGDRKQNLFLELKHIHFVKTERFYMVIADTITGVIYIN